MSKCICNITGDKFTVEDNDKKREGTLFHGFNSRFRAICYVLTKVLYNKICILEKIPIDKNIRGLGINDKTWSVICEDKFDYVNLETEFEDSIDLYNLKDCEKYDKRDFIICSEVLNHLSPYPGVQVAFDSLYYMLNNGGYLIFSVPFGYGEHVEHFPNLHNYKIEENEDGQRELFNTTSTGDKEKFTDLKFYGVSNKSLEMRIFSAQSITDYLHTAGFKQITFYSPNKDMKMRKCGIFWENECSLVVSAKKEL